MFHVANAAQLATSHANCPTVVTPDPGSIGAFPVSQVLGAEFSGTLTGDLGQIEAATLSTPCTSQPFLQLTTIYSPGIHTVKAQFTGCFDFPGTYTGTLIVVVPPFTSQNGSNPPPPPPPCGVTMIDPISSVPKLWLGDHITNRPFDLANASGIVQGVAADGVTEALLRINTTDGANVTINLTDSSGGSSTSPDEIGSLTGVDGGTPASSITLTAHDEGSGPYAYVLYHAPLNFTRANTAADAEVFLRKVQLQTFCEDSNGTTSATTPVEIVRPPIILVHGLWSNANATWANFVPVKTDENTLWSSLLRLHSIQMVNYDVPPDGNITATVPSYSSSTLSQITRNALGFTYNAPFVLQKIQSYISAFKAAFSVADVQADVVAHSMGGDIVRTMAAPSIAPSNAQWVYLTDDSYGKGVVHKLITIGTPHRGSPLATDLLPSVDEQGNSQDPNDCVRKRLADHGSISLNSATISGQSWNGGVADLVGDGIDISSLSPNLQALYNSQDSQPFPIAYIGGYANEVNFAGLDCQLCNASLLRKVCGSFGNDPLANALTSQNWQTSVFFGSSNDGIVPLTSQINNDNVHGISFPGIIHSFSLESSLDFIGPTELDQGQVPEKVVDLLNEAVAGPDFEQSSSQH